MQRVPLVVAGPTVPDPYERFETRVLDRTVDVVAICEVVAAGELKSFDRFEASAPHPHPS